jgi:hypothetical protein
VRTAVVLNGPVSGINFGNYINGAKLFALYGWVFNDTNDNGTYMPATDAGLASQNVLLYTIINGNLYFNMTLVTNASGFFSLSKLPAGTYQLDMARTGMLVNYTYTTPLSVNVTISTQDACVNFGWYYNPTTQISNTISGTVYNDTNKNGQYDYNETGLANVPLTLRYGSNFAQTNTNANGTYYFSALSPGNYTIDEIPQSGYSNTTNTEVVVNVISGTSTVNFGNYKTIPQPLYSISGLVFNDINRDGLFENGTDSPLGGWVVVFSSNGTSMPSISTNSTGQFVYSNLTAGNYSVEARPSQYGWYNSTTKVVNVLITNQSVSGLNFGYYYNNNPSQNYTISGMFFNDTDRNGIYNSSVDSVLPNWIVTLNDGNGTLLSATTDSNGNYIFFDLGPGTYTITNTPPIWASAYVNTTTMSQIVTLISGSSSNVSFGEFYNNFTVSGYVYFDLNGNGVYDYGTDYPLSGWTVNLTMAGGTPSYFTTGSTGYFQFINNPSANYTLSTLPRQGWNDESANPVSFNLTACNTTNFAKTRAFFQGLYMSYSANDWSLDNYQYLANNFTNVYSIGFVQVGISGSQGYHFEFSNITAMCSFLSNSLPASALTQSPTPDLNPPGCPGGIFGADVLALQLNVDYSNAGVGLSQGFGSLTLYNYTVGPSLNGMTVSQILTTANQVLGGNSTAMPSGYTVNSLDSLVAQLNLAFHSADVSWAQGHLF